MRKVKYRNKKEEKVNRKECDQEEEQKNGEVQETGTWIQRLCPQDNQITRIPVNNRICRHKHHYFYTPLSVADITNQS